MNHSEADITLVEKYFDEELNDAEIKDFNTRVERDENFKALVKQEMALIAAIRYEGVAANLKYLEELESNLQKETPIHISSDSTKWYYYAAAAVVVITVAFAAFMNTMKDSPEELFQAYFAPYPNMFEATTRSGETEDSKRAEAFHAYDQKDYAKAAGLFKELLKEKREPGVMLLLGNSNLMLGNIDEAKENFITLNKEFDELDIQAKWFLSLCYLKSGETDKATAILKELGNTEISYATKARELLDKVK